jgi:HD-GYP domain-containing protein (c-di-GMP phosphodiesterase class II)
MDTTVARPDPGGQGNLHGTARLSARTQRLLEWSLRRRDERLSRRERWGHGLFAAGFLVAAGLFAILATAERELDAGLAVALVLMYAVFSTAEFSSGAGYAVPTQVVFVPMLLLLPTPLVPLLVAAAVVLVALVQTVRREIAPGRIVLPIADSWFALAPAVVLVLLDAQTPDWGDWWIYVLALLAQFGLDAALSAARMRISLGIPPRDLLGELGWTYAIDLQLAPVGLLAAFAAEDMGYAPLLLLPIAGLVIGSAREREDRVRRTLELSRAYRGTALLLRDVVEQDDTYTGRHTEDVVLLANRIAEELGVDEETQRATELGALLHDLGKIVVSKQIVNKPGPLDEAEWALMRTHTLEGQRLLERVGGLLASVGVVVRASHERWDGHGYPDGRAGQEIPLAARIVAVADAFSAMTTNRPYRAALTRGVAIAELHRNAGTQFDPDVVAALERVLAGEPVEGAAVRS